MTDFLDDTIQNSGYEPKPLLPVATKWGTIGGAVAILLSVAVYIMGETIPSSGTSSTVQSMLNFVLYGMIGIQAQRVLREEQGGYLKYGRALGVGFVALMLLAVLSGIWSVILSTVIDPSIMETQQQLVMQGLADQGMSESEIEEVQEGLAIFRNPMVMIGVTIIASSILMVIIAAITAAFTKNNPPENY